VDLGVGLVGTTILMGIITIGSVIWDLKLKKYYAPSYWFLIVIQKREF